MTVYGQIIQLLGQAKVKYQSLEHEPTKTCADSARIRGTTPDQGAKALVCIADKKPIMIVLSCSRKLDAKLFKQTFGVKDLRFATPDEVKQITGLEIGSIPPFGSLFNLTTHLDLALASQKQIAFNAGDIHKSVIINYSDYIKLENRVKLANVSMDNN